MVRIKKEDSREEIKIIMLRRMRIPWWCKIMRTKVIFGIIKMKIKEIIKIITQKVTKITPEITKITPKITKITTTWRQIRTKTT